MMMNSFSLKNEEEKKAMFKNFLGLDLKKTPQVQTSKLALYICLSLNRKTTLKNLLMFEHQNKPRQFSWV